MLAHAHSRARAALSWVALGFGIAVLGLVCIGFVANIRWNMSPSLPIGLYTTRPATTIERGGFVLFCLDTEIGQLAHERRYIRGGECPGGFALTGKPVLAITGDAVIHTEDFIAVNGDTIANSWTSRTDNLDRDLPRHPYGTHVLAEGELWLHSAYHPRSFDSRYTGPISTANVQAILVPLLTR